VLVEILLNTDDEAEPGAVLGKISDVGVEIATKAPSRKGETVNATMPPPGPPPSGGGGMAIETRLSPSVRRALLQHSIDPSRIAGTGRDGRITRDDVDRAVSSATTVSVGEPATAQPRQFSAQDIPHDRMRLKIAENMVRAVSEAPHVTALFE